MTIRAGPMRGAVHNRGVELDDPFFVGKTPIADRHVVRVVFDERRAGHESVEHIAAPHQGLVRQLGGHQAIVRRDDFHRKLTLGGQNLLQRHGRRRGARGRLGLCGRSGERETRQRRSGAREELSARCGVEWR
jgi:hypothetical protein